MADGAFDIEVNKACKGLGGENRIITYTADRHAASGISRFDDSLGMAGEGRDIIAYVESYLRENAERSGIGAYACYRVCINHLAADSEPRNRGRSPLTRLELVAAGIFARDDERLKVFLGPAFARKDDRNVSYAKVWGSRREVKPIQFLPYANRVCATGGFVVAACAPRNLEMFAALQPGVRLWLPDAQKPEIVK